MRGSGEVQVNPSALGEITPGYLWFGRRSLAPKEFGPSLNGRNADNKHPCASIGFKSRACAPAVNRVGVRVPHARTSCSHSLVQVQEEEGLSRWCAI
jgi:hypothetical protein